MSDSKLLYLEQDIKLAQQLKISINDTDYQVALCHSQKRLMDHVQQQKPDFVLLDYQSIADHLNDIVSALRLLVEMPEVILAVPISDLAVLNSVFNADPIDYVLKGTPEYGFLVKHKLDQLRDLRSLRNSQQQYQSKLENLEQSSARVQSISKVGFWEYKIGDLVANWSDQEFRNFGYVPHEMIPTYDQYFQRVHPEDREQVEQLNLDCQKEFEPLDFVFRLLLPGDEIRYIRAITEVDLDEQNKVFRIFGISQDITEQKLAEAQLNLAQTVYQYSTEAIFITDKNCRILSVNPAFVEITGYSEQESIGRNPAFLSSGYHDDAFFDNFWTQLNHRGFIQDEIWNRHQNGKIFPTWQSVTAIKDDQGHVIQYVSIFSDISKRKESEELIRYQANYDSLTDLPNRNLFTDRMERAIKHGKRSNKPFALMVIDLDRFKWINDTMGHRAGDKILQETAERLKTSVRKSDTVARLGGDEFTIILPDLNHGGEAEIIAKKIFTEFSRPSLIENNEIYISGSIGISVFPEDGEQADTLFKHADSAMYLAKESGRNCYQFFTKALKSKAERKFLLITYLGRALEYDEFEIVYQPIFDLENNEIYSAEALLRWRQKNLGEISADEFIPLAEETGLIKPIGQWVVAQVAADMQSWRELGLELVNISINKSASQFSAHSIDKNWQEIFNQAQIPLSKVTIEVTESVFMEKGELYLESLQNLQKSGMQIALDDFGTGYSSLAYLKNFPVDILKIDKTFIPDVDTDSSNALLVDTIITLAKKMNIKVIAEGIENAQQLDFLKQKKCRYGQGYYFSDPLNAGEFSRYLKAAEFN